MKRLIIINLILILLILKIPNQQNVIEPQTVAIANQNSISSRSLNETRAEIAEPQIELATTISQNCVDLVKKYEGLKLEAYKLDGETNYTIGYGHSGKDVKANQTIDIEEADRLLLADLKGYANTVLDYCSYLDLTQNELDALVSFTYNCGLGNLHKLTANKTRTKEEIANHITAYTNSNSKANKKGLADRRQAEKELFLKGE
jgi:GH24 family phage-related lysozyme (muramidase)